MSNLANEIRTIPSGMYGIGGGEAGCGWSRAIREAAKIVEKREAERAERIKTFSNEYDAIRWGHDGDCGASEVVARFLESAVDYSSYPIEYEATEVEA